MLLCMSYRAVIFDLDGTLLDTLEDIATAANQVLAKTGFPTHPAVDYREFIGEGVARLMQRALPGTGQERGLVEACVEAFRTAYALNWRVKTKPYEGRGTKPD